MTTFPEAILFDLDGTLVDSSDASIEALKVVIDEYGGAPLDAYRPPLSIGVAALLDRFFGSLPSAARPALEQRFERLFLLRALEGLHLYDGVDALIQGVERRHLAWGIVTNRAASMVEPMVARLGLSGRVGCLVTGSSGLPRKPSPAPLLCAARVLGARATRSIYVGDGESDVLAAVRAKMGSYVVTWGDDRAPREPWMEQATSVFARPRDILGALDAMSP